MAVDKTLISQIKNSVNIVDVIGEVVPLTRSGGNYLGRCPFHEEKTPSFYVVENKQFFHCFGCGKSGDVFKFLEEYRQISFLESVRLLSEQSGIALNLADVEMTKPAAHPHQVLLDMHRDAAKFYQAVLKTTKEGQAAKQYLAQRGITDEVIDYFGIGLAPNETDFLYQSLSKHYDERDLMASGLFNLSEASNRFYDTFRHRIMFPLTNDRGDTIAFSGRIWSQEDSEKGLAKYKNTRSSTLFNKSLELYHLDKAKAVISKKHEVYLMEGFMDVIAAHRAGITNAVASMGTALTPQQVKKLQKYTKKIVLIYDGDNAGQEAIAKALTMLTEVSVDIVRLPQQMDPDEFLQKNTTEAFTTLLEKGRISRVEFLIHHLKPANVANLQSEIAYVETIAEIIAKEPSITAQNAYANLVADFLPDFDYYQVEQSINAYRIQQRTQEQRGRESSQLHLVEMPISKALAAVIKTECQLLHRLMHHAYLLSEFRNRSDFDFDTSELRELYGVLKEQGEIDSLTLSHLSEAAQKMYYQVLEEQLPSEIAPNEIEEIIAHRNRLLLDREVRQQEKRVREYSSQGDNDTAVSVLENIIAQKRNME